MLAHYPFDLPYKKYFSLSSSHIKENLRTGMKQVTPLMIRPCREIRFKDEEIQLAEDCVVIDK